MESKDFNCIVNSVNFVNMQKENHAFHKTIHCGKQKGVFHYSRFGKHEGNELKGYLYQK